MNEQITAGEDFIREFSTNVGIDAAFWLNPAESEQWVLYVASSDIDAGSLDAAYGNVLQTLGHKGNQWLDPFQIKLLNSDDPLAEKVVEIRDHYPARLITQYNRSSIAGVPIGGAYIYPEITAPSTTP